MQTTIKKYFPKKGGAMSFNFIFVSILLLLVSCSSHEFQDTQRSGRSSRDLTSGSSRADQDLAETPTAVSGGLYKFECNPEEFDNHSKTIEFGCNIEDKNTNENVKIEERFAAFPAPLITIASDYQVTNDFILFDKYKWKLSLRYITDIDIKEAYKSTEIFLDIQDKDSGETLTLKASLNSSQKNQGR